MKRTPALVAAAAALGLLPVLRPGAEASALTGEVAPHTVAMAWLSPDAQSPAGLELDGPASPWVPPVMMDQVTRLPAMRARVSDEAVAQHRARRHVRRKLAAVTSGCPRAAAQQPPVFDIRRS